jgi:hypothetical protein
MRHAAYSRFRDTALLKVLYEIHWCSTPQYRVKIRQKRSIQAHTRELREVGPNSLFERKFRGGVVYIHGTGANDPVDRFRTRWRLKFHVGFAMGARYRGKPPMNAFISRSTSASFERNT